MMTQEQYSDLVAHLYSAAVEIAKDSPEIIYSYEAFRNLMRHEDRQMNKWGASREQYEDALRDAYADLHHHKGSLP